MARTLYDVDKTTREMRRELVACDPGQLQTLCVSIQRNQGMLEAGTLIDVDGSRASIASQVEGVLAATVNTDAFPDPPEELSGKIAIYTAGRFLWSTVRNANPRFVFDPAHDQRAQVTGLTFEAAYVDNRWVGRP